MNRNPSDSMVANAPISPIANDTTGPVLIDFGINLITNELILEFDEPMSPRAQEDVDWAGIKFCGDAACSAGQTYSFTSIQGASPTFVFVESTHRTKLLVKMPQNDTDIMRKNLTFMTSAADTFISLDAGTPFLKDASFVGNQGTNPAGHSCSFYRFYDETTFSFYYSHYNISELETVATIKVVRAQVAYPGPVRVQVEANNGTATSPSYFTATQTWVDFAADQLEATFTVNITAATRVQPGNRAGRDDDRDATLNIIAVEPEFKVASHIGSRNSVPLTIWCGCAVVSDTCVFFWNNILGSGYLRSDLSDNPNLFRQEEIATLL
jgi:hypothetical protein